MLLFILASFLWLLPQMLFQYISCYCLSYTSKQKALINLEFQYISCYCLSSPSVIVVAPTLLFQYISCYCLSCINLCSKWLLCISIHLMLLFIMTVKGHRNVRCDFNTSHVTVYPFVYAVLLILLKFQYISCYCLSASLLSSTAFVCISIHLMLLFIHFLLLVQMQLFNFNTSHVTVYLTS